MRLWLAALLVLLAGVANAQEGGPGADRPTLRKDGDRRGPPGGGRSRFAANPSALIAAEIELKQLLPKEGQWKGLMKAAAPDARLFAQQQVVAAEWLKGRAEPLSPAEWQPQEVWMSCDGSYGVVRGTWRQADTAGRFVTLWQRQEKGEYKWLMRNGDTQAVLPGEPDMIAAHVAECRRNSASSAPDNEEANRSGAADDGSIYWREGVDADGAWSFALFSWNGDAYVPALVFDVPVSAVVH